MFFLVNNCFSVVSVVEEERGVLLHKSLRGILAGGHNAPNKQRERNEQTNKKTTTGHERTLGKLYFPAPEPVLLKLMEKLASLQQPLNVVSSMGNRLCLFSVF